VGVSVAVLVGVGVAEAVLVGVGVSVDVAVAVGVLVGVSVGVLVGVSVGVLVGVAVNVAVAVAVGVAVLVGVGVAVGRSKVAVIVVSAFIVTPQLPVPEQVAPAQPTNMEPLLGKASSEAAAPALYDAVQVGPQAIFPSPLRTAPVPVPFLTIVNV
jgi:hypothetical protein